MIDIRQNLDTSLSPANENQAVCTAATQPLKTVLPIAKHAGFSDRFFRAISNGVTTIVETVKRAQQHYQSREIARSMLNLSDAILADMALTRGDIQHVLSTRSERCATERLRLLSVERRANQRGDYRRRARYLATLAPVPFAGPKDEKGFSEPAL